MLDDNPGTRIRTLRLANGLGQVELGERVGMASGSVSMIEKGRTRPSHEVLESIARVLSCRTEFLSQPTSTVAASRPWLRAYADAPKKAVDRQMANCLLATEVIDGLELPRLPDVLPLFDGDLADDAAVEEFALEVRAAADIDDDAVVGNVTRAAERLGCLVLPMPGELGRHLGMSTRADVHPIICVSRPTLDPDDHIPGDRQRFTIAHELGHLALHTGIGAPQTAEEARRTEKQAHLFAAAFLAPGDVMLDELQRHGGRVTLRTLASIKKDWGIAIKALVMRFRTLNVIDDGQARSLYKQISARGWNKNEPVAVGNEDARWLSKAITARMLPTDDPLGAAAHRSGIGRHYLERWTDWSPTPAPSDGVLLDMTPRSKDSRALKNKAATVTRLPTRT